MAVTRQKNYNPLIAMEIDDSLALIMDTVSGHVCTKIQKSIG